MDEVAFGRYRLIEMIGAGGMGEVWRAHDTGTDRGVAIKLLPAHFSRNEEFKQRFRREAHAAARLNTPHVIPIHDYGEIDGRLYVCMRLIEGRDLQTLLADGPLEPSRAVRIVEQVAKALHAAHHVGLLHRDVKPSNILLDRDDFAYLIDFGIARAADETRLTQSGNTIGTFQYIAPERLGNGIEEDSRADIYSLACVLYESLTGSPPFAGDTMARLVTAHLSTPPPRPSSTQPDVPPAVDAVIATGMAKNPDERYATTIELANAARDALTTPIRQPTASPTSLRAQVPNPVSASNPTDKRRPPPPPSPWAPAFTRGGPEPRPYQLAHFGSPGKDQRAHWTPPPARPAPIRGAASVLRRQGRRTAYAVIACAVVILGVVLAVAIPATLGNQGSPSTSQSTPPSPTELSFSSPGTPAGVAVDSGGNLYVAVSYSSNSRVLKLAADSSPQTELPFTDLRGPAAVAVDSAANVYVTDKASGTYATNRVLELAAGSLTQTTVRFTDLRDPAGLAVDSTGAIYVADTGNNRVLKLAAGSSTQTELPFSGLSQPAGVAVDSYRNLYVTDTGNNRVLKLIAGSSMQINLPFSGLSRPASVAVDSTGNLYVTSTGNSRVVKLAAGSSTQTDLPFNGLSQPAGVAVDSTGIVYVVDAVSHRVLKLAAG